MQVLATYMHEADEGWIGLDDHSKWAVSLPSRDNQPVRFGAAATGMAGQHVVCFGDLNREVSQVRCVALQLQFCGMRGARRQMHETNGLHCVTQAYRGGGAVCFTDNAALWWAMSALVVLVGRCQGAS